jgi:UPF0716 protein FxsA
VPFFLIFIAIPLIEIAVFISVGDELGLFNTLALCFLTAVIGGAIFRYQGLRTFDQAIISVNRGELPVDELFHGFCLVIAAATLVTPGFVTDALGFFLLVPSFRKLLRRVLANHASFQVHSSTEFHHDSRDCSCKGRRGGKGTIEGEYEKIDEKDSE